MHRCEPCPVRADLPCPDAGRYCRDLTPARCAQLVAIAEHRARPKPVPVPVPVSIPVFPPSPSPYAADPYATNPYHPASNLVFRVHDNTFTGYGQHAAAYAKAVDPFHAVRIAEIDRCDSLSPLDPWVTSRVVPMPPTPVVVFSTPGRQIRPGDMLATMWEASRIQPDAVANCNRASCVVVTCPDVADWFRESGVTVPIRIAPLGIDTSIFRPTRPEPTGKVVFGAGARTVHGGLRKGMGDVIAAFQSAFPGRDDVELRIKVWADCTLPEFADPRIVVDTRSLTDAEIADWLRDCSAFVSASRGEGWGFWAHQSLAVGRPIIAPLWGGTKVYADESCAYPVEYDVLPVPRDFDTYGGNGAAWSVPRMDSLVAQMRAAAGDPAVRAAKGRAGAEKAARFTWGHAGEELRRVLAEFGFIPGGSGVAEASTATPDATTARPSVGNQIADILKVRACPHRTPPECGCPSVDGKCGLGKGRGGLVVLSECLECVAVTPELSESIAA